MGFGPKYTLSASPQVQPGVPSQAEVGVLGQATVREVDMRAEGGPSSGASRLRHPVHLADSYCRLQASHQTPLMELLACTVSTYQQTY